MNYSITILFRGEQLAKSTALALAHPNWNALRVVHTACSGYGFDPRPRTAENVQMLWRTGSLCCSELTLQTLQSASYIKVNKKDEGSCQYYLRSKKKGRPRDAPTLPCQNLIDVPVAA